MDYGFASLAAPLITSVGWYLVSQLNGNSRDLDFNLVYLALICGAPILAHSIVNPVLCHVLRKRSFSIVFPASLCSYVVVCAIYLAILGKDGREYIESDALVLWRLSLFPVVSNVMLLWLLGIRSNTLFAGDKLQRWWN